MNTRSMISRVGAGSAVCAILAFAVAAGLLRPAAMPAQDAPDTRPAVPRVVPPVTLPAVDVPPAPATLPAPTTEPVAPDTVTTPSRAASQPTILPPQAASQAASAPAGEEPAANAATQTASAPTTLAASQPASAPTTQLATTRPTSRPVATNAPFAMNFKDASLRAVLEYLSEVAGLVVIQDNRAEGRVTVISKDYVSADKAISLLDTVLRQKGFAAIRNNDVLKIVPLDQAKKELVPVRSGNDPKAIDPTDRVVTQIIPIRYADATKLKADLASLVPATADITANSSSNMLIVTDSEANIRKLVEIISAIDIHMSEVSQVRVFQLKYANASNAAKLINDVFREDSTAGGQPGGGGFSRRAFFFQSMMGGGGGPPGFGGGGGGGGQSTTDRRVSKVNASADERTNTLVVSAPPDLLKVIEGVIKDLDANPAEQQSVFIYRLKNSTASDLEGVLNNVFGTGGGSVSGGTSQNRGTFGAGGFGAGGSSFGGRSGGGSSSVRGLGNTANTRSSYNSGRAGISSSRTYGSNRGYSGMSSPLGTGVPTDLIGQVYVVADIDTNSLLVTTSSKNFDRVKTIIAELDKSVPQVLIKVLIAEVTHSNALDLGVEFAGFNLSGNTNTFIMSGSNATGGFKTGTDFGVAAQNTGFTFKINENYATAAIRALANKAKLDVLSRPYILTSDNQEATIMVGQSVPFVTNTQTFDTGAVYNSIEYDDIGIILNVTPHINPQGLVTLDVYPEISTLTGQTVPVSTTFSAPVFAKRFAQSRVAVRDGETIVIGGLMEDRIIKSVDKVPFLGDLPYIGAIFSHVNETKAKTELLIFLTPHVAQEPKELGPIAEQEKANTKLIQDAVEPGAFQDHMRGMKIGSTTKPTTRPADSRPEEYQPTSFPVTGGQ